MVQNLPSPPIKHIGLMKRYEWMLCECAAANAQRQAREDRLVGTITQISSAALLGVSRAMFAAEVTV